MSDTFKIEIIDNIAHVTFDLFGMKMNILSMAINNQISELAVELAKRQDLDGMIFVSAKPNCFVAGADISEIEAIATPDQGTKLSKIGQSAFNALSALPYPTVAVINGYCLGGGLELAMSFDYRIGGHSEKALLGLPETTIGVIPGFGGTQRLPGLVGPERALKMILSGEHISSEQAHAYGLIDKITDSRDLIPEAVKIIHKTPKNTNASPDADQSFLNQNKLDDIFARTWQELNDDTTDPHPALLYAIDALEFGLIHDLKTGLDYEADLFGEITASESAKKKLQEFRQRKKK